ncbi:spaetzle domain-containing protein [Rhynchophorus ferrugineus]|uniref:Spaetzle domain-containing protein n=1 Tax=Rhynchophorus ferrugineus TaxID=354439 RepID=A0A834MM81_RHYFE|nr:hypothetical protein GWI33_010636 [Rhynchophorus ferrugineus]
MVAPLCTIQLWIILVVLQNESSARPQDGNTGSKTIEFLNETRLRILTNPPKKDLLDNDQEIIFPDDPELVNPVSRIDVFSKCSEDFPLCENAEAYPYNHLKTVLQQNLVYKDLFGADEVPEVANRIGEEDDVFVCRSITRTIFPKMGQNKNNKWKFIINQGDEDGFVQGVRIEICRNLDGECDFPGYLPEGYKTSCRQKYVYRRLLSVNNDGNPIPDTFKIPSACCCAYKQNLDFLSRFGKQFTPATKRKNKK